MLRKVQGVAACVSPLVTRTVGFSVMHPDSDLSSKPACLVVCGETMPILTRYTVSRTEDRSRYLAVRI